MRFKNIIVSILIFVVSCCVLFLGYQFLFKPVPSVETIKNNETYDLIINDVSKKETKEIKIQRKKQILNRIDEINKELGGAPSQQRIDELAKEKMLLIKEYQSIDEREGESGNG